MLNGEIVVATLKELLKRGNSSEGFDGKLKDVCEKAHRRMVCGGHFPSQLVMSTLCGALRTRRPRIVEPCLVCLQHILHVQAFYPGRVFVGDGALPCFSPGALAASRLNTSPLLFASPHSSASTSSSANDSRHALVTDVKILTIGATLVECLVDLLTLSETAIQLKALELILFCVHPPSGFLRTHRDMAAAADAYADDADPSVHGALHAVEGDGGASHRLDDTFGLYSSTLFHTLDGCFRLSITTIHSGVQISSYGVMTTLLRRAVRTFAVEAVPNPLGTCTIVIGGSGAFGGKDSTTFVSDVSPLEPFTPVSFYCRRKDHPPSSTEQTTEELEEEIAENAVRDIFSGPQYIPLRDLIAVIKGLCFVSCRPLPPGATDEQSEAARARIQGLRLLYLILEELPVANHESEHPSAYWVALVVESCKYELLKTIGRSLATATPLTFFTAALDVLQLLLHKVHYHMHRELHAMLNIMLFPLMRSRVSSACQKISFLHMARSIVSTPHLLIAYFINYDCSVAFDPGSPGSGLVSCFMETLVSLPFVAYHRGSSSNSSGESASVENNSWCSEEQQTMICTEVIRVMHDFVLSLKRWVYDDPRVYSKMQDAEAIGSVSRNFAGDGNHRAVATELYLDHWSHSSASSSTSEDDDAIARRADEVNSLDGDFATGASSDPTGTQEDINTSLASNQEILVPVVNETHGAALTEHSAEVSGTFNATAGAPHGRGELAYAHTFSLPGASAKRKAHPIAYHWKHVHMCLHNRRLLDEAAAKTNSNWRLGRAFLVEKRILPSEKDYLGFAKFLREHPAIEKSMLCSIFERVNKDPECVKILEAYLSTFEYSNVPIDIALRDTTCEFMSWDRPQFEAQVWERIQSLFGATYAAQNPGKISEVDSDVMAGVLLFLHTSLHNHNVKQQSKMTREQFIRDGGACMETPLPDCEMEAMFQRVCAKRWALDEFQRTPRQQEQAQQQKSQPNVPSMISPFLPKFSSSGKVSSGRAVDAPSSDPTAPEHSLPQTASAVFLQANSTLALDGCDGNITASASCVPQPDRRASSTLDSFGQGGSSSVSPRSATLAPPVEHRSSTARRMTESSDSILASSTLFESNFHSYTDNADRLRLKIEHEQRYVKTAMAQLSKLEAEHRRQAIATPQVAWFTKYSKPPSSIQNDLSFEKKSGDEGISSLDRPQSKEALDSSFSPAVSAVSKAPLLPDLHLQAPYLAPYYAQHVQPMFVTFYAHVVAVCYVGLRTLKQEPVLRLVLDIYQNLFDVAAAFCVNVNQLQGLAEKLIQKCLRQDNSIDLSPENIRASITPYLMNQL